MQDLGYAYALPQDHKKLLLVVMVMTMVTTEGKPNHDCFP